MLHVRAGLAVALAALGLASFLPAARAQTVTQTTGPDIIVCTFPDVSNNAPATVNGVLYDSFCVGTTSANRGSVPVNWLTGTGENRHPAISQNIFRYSAATGRFEQLGQGSLKHGFTALQDADCAAPNYFNFGCTATAGTSLGTGCSDPYCCGLNNVIGSGGPKWQVNAATGLFPYPVSTTYQGTSGPPRVRLSELNAAPAGTRYFMEGQYIVGDDAAVGNKFNNATWQEVSMTPTGTPPAATDFTIDLIGAVHRERAGIYAWQAIDPTVQITTFDEPNDGRFILAVKVTGPVAGLYTYEYALQNMNSNRCAGSFTVPLPGGQSALSNIGFHDVECVAEPNATPVNAAADDWTVSGGGAGAASVTWSGPAYAGTPAVYAMSSTAYKVQTFTPGTGNDHSANVLRWGTMFNFRFTSELPPGNAGSVTVGLWRPGTDSSFTIQNVPTPGAACNPAPCAPGVCCQAGGCYALSYPVCSGTWIASGTCTPNPCPQPSGACCASNSCFSATFSNCSGTWQGADTTCATSVCPAGNDLCANAVPLCDGVGRAGTNSGAGTDGTASCTNTGRDVWYTYIPATSGAVVVDTCTATFDTAISVRTGACPGTTEVGCDDDTCGSLHSRVTVTMTAGTRYLIRVAGYASNVGNFTVKVTGGGGQGCNVSGACCTGTACASTTQAACTGSYQGDSTTCGPVGNPTTCCPANYNQTGGVNVQDIFDFLNGWFAAAPAADFNHANGITVQDIFDFLGAWFTGC